MKSTAVWLNDVVIEGCYTLARRVWRRMMGSLEMIVGFYLVSPSLFRVESGTS
jgi:hypothetical protein